MNDCIWGFIFCECSVMCDEYISANTEQGGEMLDKYETDVEDALVPVKAKWEQIKKESGIDE